MPHAELLGIEDVVDIITETFGIEGTEKNGEFEFLCVVHEDTHPSARCNTETGIWGCWACNASGDLIDLGIATLIEGGILMGQATNKKERIKRKEQRKQIEELLSPQNIDALAARIQRRARSQRKKLMSNPDLKLKRKQKSKLSIPPLGSYEDGPLDSLYARGFNEDFLREWNVRYVTSERLEREDGTDFEITHSIAIPIVEPDGETMIGWCYRSTEDSEKWQPRYIYTPQCELSEIWFGLDHAPVSEEVTITEGALDAMWCAMHGYPSLAILGSNVKKQSKIRALTDYPSVCLFPDDDNAGLIWSMKLGGSLQEMGVPCTVVRLASFMLNRDGKPAGDANELCGIDLELVRELALPYFSWKLRTAA